MATTQRGRRRARTVSEAFRSAFDACSPKVSYGDIATAVSERLGVSVTDQAIANYHTGKVTKRPNLVLIAAIADVYGLRSNDLPEDIAQLCAQALDVLGELHGRSTPPGTRTRNLQISHAA